MLAKPEYDSLSSAINCTNPRNLDRIFFIASDPLISLLCAPGVGKSIVGMSFLLREGFQLGSDAASGFYHVQESILSASRRVYVMF